jgi:MFS family permease
MAAGRPQPAPNLLPLVPVYTVIFIGFVGYSLMITVFTPMMMYAHNGMLSVHSRMSHRTIMLGLLLSLYPLGQLFGSPVLGALSDRFGRRRILLVSLTITTACYALIGTALYVQSLEMLMGVSLITGLAEGNVVIAQSAIADLTTAESRNRLFGYIYLSASLAFVVGPLAGGKLADSSLVPWFGYATPFWAVFGLLLVTLLWTAIVFRETHARRLGGTIAFSAALNSLAQVLNDRPLRLRYGVNFLLYLTIYGFFRTYPMYLVDQFHLNVSRVSEFIAWVAVPIVLANLWLTDFFARRATTEHIVAVSGALTGVCMIAVTVPPQVGALWVTLFLTGLALAICLPACATMISNAASPSEQGQAMGNNQSLQVGAEALSGAFGGLLAAILVALPLIVLAVFGIVAAGLLAWFTRGAEPEA